MAYGLVPSMWLAATMATNYDWLGGVRYNSSYRQWRRPLTADGAVRPCTFVLSPSCLGPCHRSRRGSKLSIFETHRHCDALDELILTHCTVSRASLSFTRKCGPKSAGFFGLRYDCSKNEKTSSKETEKLEKWLQKTEANLKIEFGVPDKVNFKTNGSREYVYLSKKLSISCERKFEINSKNIIIGFTSKNCF